jgi:hypothetical protein
MSVFDGLEPKILMVLGFLDRLEPKALILPGFDGFELINFH